MVSRSDLRVPTRCNNRSGRERGKDKRGNLNIINGLRVIAMATAALALSGAASSPINSATFLFILVEAKLTRLGPEATPPPRIKLQSRTPEDQRSNGSWYHDARWNPQARLRRRWERKVELINSSGKVKTGSVRSVSRQTNPKRSR